MTEVKSDEQRCDTCTTPAEASMDEMANEKENETSTNSSTVNFAERSWKNDFTLIVEDTRFCVAKNILALASPVFDRMFESDYKERTTDELELPGKKTDDVKEFLLAIYPNTASPMSRENALKVLPLAEEYQVLNLKQRCEEALMGCINALTSVEELYLLIKEGHLYNLKELVKRCVSFVCEKPAEEVERVNREIVLPGEPLSDILQNLNDRLVSRVKELESSNLFLLNQLKTYKTWKHYFTKDFAKSGFLNLDEDIAWQRQMWMFTIDVKKMSFVEDTVIIWNIEFRITFGFKGENGRVIARLMNQDKQEVKCEFFIQFAFLNKLPKAEHLLVKQKFQFYLGQQSTSYNVATLFDIEGQQKGFIYGGKVQVEVNILMSEPKKLETSNSVSRT